jgi:hypothetical protein
MLSFLLLPIRGMAQVPPPPLVPAPSEAEGKSATPSSDEDPYGGYEDEDEEEKEEPPPGESIPREWPPSSVRKVTRITLAILGGTVLGLTASAPGIYLAGDAAFCEGCDDTFGQFLLGISLGSAGLMVGSALGIWGIGSLLWGEGRFLPTLVGTLVGSLAGLVVGVVLEASAGGGLWPIPIFTFPIIGGMIAYESSHTDALEQKAREMARGMSVTPMVGVSPRGGIIGGLAGVF